MKAEKSHYQPSIGWKPRKASGIIWYKSKGLKIREVDGVNPSPRVEEDETRYLPSISEAGKKE